MQVCNTHVRIHMKVMSPRCSGRRADGALSNGARKGAFNHVSSFKWSVVTHTHLSLYEHITRQRCTHTHTSEHRTSWGPGWSCWAGCGGAPWPLSDRSTPRRQRWLDTRQCPGSTARWTRTDTTSDWSHTPREKGGGSFKMWVLEKKMLWCSCQSVCFHCNYMDN